MKTDLQVPADWDSLKLKEQDRKDLLSAVEEYNKLRGLYFDLDGKRGTMINTALLYGVNLVTLRQQLYDARSNIAVAISSARSQCITNDCKSFVIFWFRIISSCSLPSFQRHFSQARASDPIRLFHTCLVQSLSVPKSFDCQ
jgi:hypothetical protein